MQLKDKIIIVYYVDIREIDKMDVPDYMDDVYHSLKENDNTVHQVFVPIYNDSRVECINPKYLSEEEVEKVSHAVEELIAKADEWINKKKHNNI